MAKLLLMSVMIASVAIPAWTSRAKNSAAGAKKTIIYFAIFTAVWIVYVGYYFADVTGPVDLDPFKTKERENQ